MNFRKIRKIKKNTKALSPVIATIILIAITVAVSVVVAAWMGALTIGFMGNAEQASIINVVLTNTADGAQQAAVTVQNAGSATVTISLAYIDGNTATMSTSAGGATVTSIPIDKGTSVTFYITCAGVTFSDNAQYTINLVTAKGNTISNQATYSDGF